MSAPDFAAYPPKRWAELLELERALAERGLPPTERSRGVSCSVTTELEALVADGLAVLAGKHRDASGQVVGQLAELTSAGWAVAHAVRRWRGDSLVPRAAARAEAAAEAWVHHRMSRIMARRRGAAN